MISFPPFGMASRAFTAKLTITCSSCAGSDRTAPKSAGSTVTTSMSSPIKRRTIFSVPLHHAVQVEHLGLHGLPAGEGQKPAHQRARPVARLQNLIHVGAKLVLRPQKVLGQLRVAGDDGQEVVEIVRHAAGQAPHRLHLLRLAKFLLQLLVLGNVHHHAAELADLAAFISHHADDILEPDRLAVRGDRPVAEAVISPLRNRFAAPLDDVFAILRMDVLNPEIRLLQPPFHGEAQNGFHLVAHESYFQAGHFHFPDAGIQILNEIAEPLRQFLRGYPQVLALRKILGGLADFQLQSLAECPLRLRTWRLNRRTSLAR